MRGILAVGVIVLLLVAAGADSHLSDIARTNLSNAAFERDHVWDPRDQGLEPVAVTVDAAPVDLAGWWVAGSGENATRTVILVHGLGSTMSRVVRMWGPSLHDAGYSILAIDLRNHGASPDAGGRVTYGVDEAKDVLAAVAYVRNNAQQLGVDPNQIVLYGASMGAATVINAAGQAPAGVVGVLADSSFASFRFEAAIDGKARGYPAFVVDLVLAKMDRLAPSPPTSSRPEQHLASLQVPLLLAQCLDDRSITLPNHVRLVRAAPAGTVTWVGSCPEGLSPDNHVDGWMDPTYNTTVLRFLASATASRRA